MALYVQTWPWDAECYWVELSHRGTVRVSSAPHRDYGRIIDLIDTKSGSLLLVSSRQQVGLLATGLPSERATRQAPRVTNALFAVSDRANEAAVSDLASALLQPLSLSGSQRWLESALARSIDACIGEGRSGATYDVDEALVGIALLSPFVEPLDNRHGRAASTVSMDLRIGRNTLLRRAELGSQLAARRLEWHRADVLTPCVAVTGLQTAERLLEAGARWVLTDLVETESWPAIGTRDLRREDATRAAPIPKTGPAAPARQRCLSWLCARVRWFRR